MHSHRKALPQVAAILFFLILASVVAPKNSVGLPLPQSPIFPTTAAYLPLTIRDETVDYTPVVYVPLAIKEKSSSSIIQREETHSSVNGTIQPWESSTWTAPRGLVSIK